MSLPRLAVFDVDGTLIDHTGRCSPATRSALDRLRAAGVVVAIATGRPQASLAETLETIGPVDYAVCGNGSHVSHVQSARVLRQSVVPGELVAGLVPAMRRDVPGVGAAVELHDRIVEEPGLDRRLPPRKPAPVVADVIAALGSPLPDVHRAIFFHDDHDDDVHALAAVVDRHIDARVHVFFGALLPIVEVMPAGDNKAVGLASLTAHLDIAPGDVIAFGDGSNDVEMFDWVGWSVAMANASASVKNRADSIAGSVADDGVAEFVNRLLA